MRTAWFVLLAGVAAALTDIEHKPFKRKNIDPTIFPGKYVSHMHSFYGSDAITRDLPTSAELQKGCPSGENPNDLSIYCTVFPATLHSLYSISFGLEVRIFRGPYALLREWR
jgi:hypothetical protein